MPGKIWLRVDGDHQMGLGHLIRCMALAQMLKKEYEVHFVCKKIPDRILEDFRTAKIKVIKINDEQSFPKVIRPRDIVVLDGYQFDSDYQLALKKTGCTLVCIDDVYDKKFHADLIINPAPGITHHHYRAQSYTRYALGPEFVLLREIFTKNARGSTDISTLSTVFICFGGSDARNLTGLTYKTVKEAGIFESIQLVTGPSYEHKEELQSQIEGDASVNYHHAITAEQMAELIERSDVAIVPASGILIEVLALGKTVISGYYANNQKHSYREYLRLGAFIDAGKFEPEHLRKALSELTERFQHKSLNGLKNQIIDGESPQRFRQIFRKLTSDQKIPSD